jgi:hypothetical protein
VSQLIDNYQTVLVGFFDNSGMQMPVQRPNHPEKPAKKRVKRPLRPANSGPRIQREKRTIAAMIGIFCRDHGHSHGHGTDALCEDCSALLSYARQRLDHCVFGELKEPCNHCSVDCYSKTLRPRIVAVMDYAGPRLTLRHPLLGLLHLFDQRRAR